MFGQDEANRDDKVITKKVFTDPYYARSFAAMYGGALSGNVSSPVLGGMVEAATLKCGLVFPSALMQSVVFHGRIPYSSLPFFNQY